MYQFREKTKLFFRPAKSKWFWIAVTTLSVVTILLKEAT